MKYKNFIKFFLLLTVVLILISSLSVSVFAEAGLSEAADEGGVPIALEIIMLILLIIAIPLAILLYIVFFVIYFLYSIILFIFGLFGSILGAEFLFFI